MGTLKELAKNLFEAGCSRERARSVLRGTVVVDGAFPTCGAVEDAIRETFNPWVYMVKRLVISKKVGDWCRLPYPGHPKGCPNYGKKSKCPPRAPMIEDYFDTSQPMCLVHSEFDLEGHAERMRAAHPGWSDRRCRCVLYWQPRSRKQLMERVLNVMNNRGLNAVTGCPEAMGLNVYATARLAGLRLESIRNLSVCRHVALLGSRRSE